MNLKANTSFNSHFTPATPLSELSPRFPGPGLRPPTETAPSAPDFEESRRSPRTNKDIQYFKRSSDREPHEFVHQSLLSNGQGSGHTRGRMTSKGCQIRGSRGSVVARLSMGVRCEGGGCAMGCVNCEEADTQKGTKSTKTRRRCTAHEAGRSYLPRCIDRARV